MSVSDATTYFGENGPGTLQVIPKILFVATSRWFATARLAMAMARTGCEVSAVCPSDHPLATIRAARGVHRYRATAPLRSIQAAISTEKPHFVIPADDSAALQLHRLHRRAESETESPVATRALIEYSLGAAASFPVVRSRTSLIRVACELGVRTPSTAVVGSMGELHDWLRRHGFPAVLKSDGTYGGAGVSVVNAPDEAFRALSALSSPPSPARAVKRALINRDTNYLVPCVRRTLGVVNVQAFVAGQDANVTVACWKGQVLAQIAVAVLRTTGPGGPASVVRVIDNVEMDAGVEKIVARLRLSGIVGFDFILQDHTGDPYLIEMNPRATQTGHLQLGPGRDLPGSLRAALTGEPLLHAARVTSNDVIAYFPQEWLRDPRSQFLSSAYHDVPWEESDAIRASVAEPFRIRAWTAAVSLTRAVRGALRQQASRC